MARSGAPMTRRGAMRVRWAVLGVLAGIAPQSLAAQDSTTFTNHLYDKLSVIADFTTVLNRSNARLDGSNGDAGTTLDFKSMLGISGTLIQPALGLRWKPGRHTELDLGYQFINANGNRAFADTLHIGDDTVSGNIDATTKLGSSNATLQFKYSLWAAERHNIGLAIGLGAVLFHFKLDATADGCSGPNCASGTLNVDKSFTGPTASLGAFGQWRLGDRWYVGGDARGLGAHVDRFKFSVFEGDANARYYLSNRWGLGLAWYYTNVTVNVAPKSGGNVENLFVGKVAYNYSSFRAGVLFVF